ncbi:MAG: GHKL domain-containing protein [Bdellovibrionaceae bacterium]|nr:GHKL domain-containing protein [Pseudobdellovibrionaceae bacterium]
MSKMFKLDSFEKKVNLITVVICLTILFSISREYQSGMSQRDHEVLNQFNSIHANLRIESQLITKFVSTSRRFAENYFLFSRDKSSPWLKNLKYDDTYKGSYLVGLNTKYKEQKLGNLTSISTNYMTDPEKKIEISMALEMGSYFAPGLNEIKSSPWYYYTSSDFMYLAPYLEPKDFFFSKRLLVDKEFYKNATPENNPKREGFWTSVYVDEAGLGLMISYSEPVYDGDTFKGSISMDVTIDQFNTVLHRHDYSLGKLVLYNHFGQVLAEPTSVGSADPRISMAHDLIPANLIEMAKNAKTNRIDHLLERDSHFIYYEDFPELSSTLVFFVPAQKLRWLTVKKMAPFLVFSLLSLLLIFWLRRTFLNDYVMQQNFIQNAKMSALGRMAAGMAHEINNPLAIIVGKANGLKRLVDSPKPLDASLISQDLGKILSTANRIAKIINSLRSFSRNGEQDPFFDTNLKSWLNETLELCRQTMISHSTTLTVAEIPNLMIRARESQLSQVLLNLLNNSVDAIKHQETKEITISFEVTKSMLHLFVRDSGPGIPHEIQSRLMEPFFTTKAPGAGTGLGLSISLGIMREHQGTMRFVSKDSKTCFVMEIPLA